MALAGSNRKPALTAAAAKIGYSRATVGKLREESWQDRAWQVYDKLPAVFYMTRYRSDVASKIDYFAATIDEPGMDPEVDETGAGTKVLEAEGGPELLRRIVSEFVVHWDIPGEGYLTRFDTEPFWRVLSTQELIKLGDRFMWGDETNKMGTIEADQVYRVWDPHPRFHWLADSPVRHILEEAEELILLSRTAKVQSMSQVSAGILILPDTVDLSPFAEDEGGTEDDVARWLLEVLSRPITDPGSSASVVPAVMSMHGDDIAKVRHVTFDRDWNINLDLRKELLAAVATGLDLPPEILTGMSDLNHWSAWLVSEQAVSQHVLPSVDAILDSLTTNWFRPLLEASGVDPEGYVLWRDPSSATVSPDQSDVAIRLYEVDAISGEAVRRVTNFDEEDAPTPEELDEKTARRSQSQQGVETDGPPVQAAIDPDDAERFVELLNRNPELARLIERAWNQEGDPPLAEAAVTAAARRRLVATELAAIDQELLAWVVEESEKEIERLLRIVDKSLTAAADPLDESMLSRLAGRIDQRIEQAQARARGWLQRLLGTDPSFADEAQTRSQGVSMIIGGIVEAIRNRLFTPGPTTDPIDTGRLPDVSSPMQAIRNGLSQAGGGLPNYEDGHASELIGNGQRVHDELTRNGFSTEAYVWVYGHPAHSFEPHNRLSGVEFDSWESPKLAVGMEGSWLHRPFYKPGDHRGCQCSFEQILILPRDIGDGGEALPTVGGEGNLSTDGMSPEEAATYRQVRRDMMAKYPRTAAQVRHWGTGEDAGSRTALRGQLLNDRDRFEAIRVANPGVNAESLAAQARMRHIDQAIGMVDEGDFVGAFSHEYGGGFNGVFLNGDTIVVRPGITRQAAGGTFKVDVPEDWNAVRYTATHEFGHALEHDLLEQLGDRTPLGRNVEIERGYTTFQDAIVRTGAKGKTVSDYGASNHMEGFAENFVAREADIAMTSGQGGASMDRLLTLADEAKSWPTYENRVDNLMRPVEWVQLLDELGPRPIYGYFQP